jgi:hypothetical protein
VLMLSIVLAFCPQLLPVLNSILMVLFLGLERLTGTCMGALFVAGKISLSLQCCQDLGFEGTLQCCKFLWSYWTDYNYCIL